MSVRVPSLGGGAGALGSGSLANACEARLYIPGLVSGVDIVAALDGWTRWGGVGQVANLQSFWNYRAGAAAMLFQIANGRRWVQPQPAAGAFSTAYLRRWARTGLQLDAIDFHDVYGATTSPVAAAGVPPYLAVRVGAWMRKVAAGDATSCRVCFGFADNTFLSPTALIARCGLLGDGLLGYRFGSVNCPDGTAFAVENAHTDIDPGSVQPPELVNPGVVPFYVDITMVPPTPVSGGFWFGRLNGRVAAVGGTQAIFTQVLNFPRGSGGASNDFGRDEGLWMSNEGTQGRVPLYSQVEAVWTENLTLSPAA